MLVKLSDANLKECSKEIGIKRFGNRHRIVERIVVERRKNGEHIFEELDSIAKGDDHSILAENDVEKTLAEEVISKSHWKIRLGLRFHKIIYMKLQLNVNGVLNQLNVHVEYAIHKSAILYVQFRIEMKMKVT